MTKQNIQPLGHASPERYQAGAWTTALLQRMAFWVKKIHQPEEAVLDIGCGEGALFHVLGYQGIGVDLNINRLSLAKARHLDVLIADGTALPFKGEQFQTVISMEVLEHVPEMTKMMQDVYRVLQPQGYWLVSVPSVTLRSKYEMWREKRPYYCDADEHYREFSPYLPQGFEHRFMQASAFKMLFEESGFEVVAQDGVRYIFPQWFTRLPWLQKFIESSKADRLWSKLPWFKRYPYWTILVLRKNP